MRNIELGIRATIFGFAVLLALWLGIILVHAADVDAPLMPNADRIPEVIAHCTLHSGSVQCRKFFLLMTRGACGTAECARRLKGVPL